MKSYSIYPLQTSVHLNNKASNRSKSLRRVPMELEYVECDCDCTSDCACVAEDHMMYEDQSPVHLHFTNRDHELTLLLTPRHKKIVLGAPTGYGKTYLLKEAARKLEAMGKKVIYVDLAYNDTRGKTLPEIFHEIGKQIGNNKPESLPYAADQVLDALVQFPELTLMFDSTERAQTDVVKWLKREIPLTREKMRGQDYKIIFTARYVNPPESIADEWRGYKEIPLKAIRIEHIIEVLNSLLEDPRFLVYKQNLHPDFICQVAENIAWLSAGHPGSIENIVQEWIRSRFQKDFHHEMPEDILKSIFIDCVHPHVLKFQHELGEKLFSLMRVVSVFRMIDRNILCTLEGKGLIEGPEQALSKILAMQLFVRRGGYITDGVARQLVARELEILNIKLYKEYNHIARSIWEEQLKFLLHQPSDFPNLDILISNMLRNIIYQALGEGLSGADFLKCIRTNLFKIKSPTKENVPELVDLYLYSVLENSIDHEGNWIENLEIKQKLKVTAEDLKIDLLTHLPETTSMDKSDPGEKMMKIEIDSNLLDALADALNFLRHNAQNVLRERWEKRNLDKAETPPIFKDDPDDLDSLKRSLVKQNIEDIKDFATPEGKTVIISKDHIQKLMERMQKAQKSVDMYANQLANPLAATEKVALQAQILEYQEIINSSQQELADILVHLYSPKK